MTAHLALTRDADDGADTGGEEKFKPMSKKQLAHFEKRLLEERQRVLKELGHYDETFGSTPQGADGDLSSYSFHMADQGTDAMEREKAFLFASQEGRFLWHIDEALRRLYRSPETFGQVPQLRRGDRLRPARRAAARALLHRLQAAGREWQEAGVTRLLFGVDRLGDRASPMSSRSCSRSRSSCRRYVPRAGDRRLRSSCAWSTTRARRSGSTSAPGRAGSSSCSPWRDRHPRGMLRTRSAGDWCRVSALAIVVRRRARQPDRPAALGAGVVDFIDVGVGALALADVQRGGHGA